MQAAYIFGTLFLGWVLALLVNYLSDVLPFTRSLSLPECSQCHHPFSMVEYITFRKCPDCNSKRSYRSWTIQALIPAVLLWLLFNPPGRLDLWMSAIVLGFFAVVAVIDFEHRAILYQESVFGAVIGLALGFYLHGIVLTILGGLAGFGIMLVLYYLGVLFGKLVAHLRKQDYSDAGLGFGDVTLAGVLGLMMGWPGITAGLILAILLAGMVSAVYLLIQIIAHRYKVFSSIPYAPFLVLGSAILLFRP
jgi:leader peptidase (prepilin peptidase) / N-methyltransferase